MERERAVTGSSQIALTVCSLSLKWFPFYLIGSSRETTGERECPSI